MMMMMMMAMSSIPLLPVWWETKWNFIKELRIWNWRLHIRNIQPTTRLFIRSIAFPPPPPLSSSLSVSLSLSVCVCVCSFAIKSMNISAERVSLPFCHVVEKVYKEWDERFMKYVSIHMWREKKSTTTQTCVFWNGEWHTHTHRKKEKRKRERESERVRCTLCSTVWMRCWVFR